MCPEQDTLYIFLIFIVIILLNHALYNQNNLYYTVLMDNESKNNFQKNRISFALDELSLSAAALSRESGVGASIINKWKKGSRSLTSRSHALRDVAAALLRLDTQGVLTEHYAPYRYENEDDTGALVAWLSGVPMPGMLGRIAPPTVPTSGEYTVEHVVYLGQKGFRKAAIAMLDYLMILPPNQTMTVLCQGKWEWFIQDITFVLQFIGKLKKVVERGTCLRVINRKGYSLADSAAFAGYWLTAHMKGYIRSLYYEGEMPKHVRFIASIPSYWSGRAEEDARVEDGLYVSIYTDPRETQCDAALCEEYAAISSPSSQYAFFESPLGDHENSRLWRSGSLPRWEEKGSLLPDGSFYALCRVPGIAIATQDEAHTVAGSDAIPSLPVYLLRYDESFATGPHKIILCREDVQEALGKERRMHEVLSAVLHRRAFVTCSILSAQLRRLLSAMEEREDFEVALMPRSAFEKIGIELISFRNSVTIGWLQDMSESVFCDDEATAGSFYGYLSLVWDRLHKGWKRKRNVAATLRKWLAGKELDGKDQDSKIVKNWDMTPKE